MKNLLRVLILVLNIYNLNSQSLELNSNSTKNDTISFKIIGFHNHYREIVLLNNADFIRIENNVTDYGGGRSTFEKLFGKYELTDSILTLKPKKFEFKIYTGNPENKTIIKKFDYVSNSQKKVPTVFVVKYWGNFQYLIPIEYSNKNLKFEKATDIIKRRLFLRKLKPE